MGKLLRPLPYDPNKYDHDPRKPPLTPKLIMALAKKVGKAAKVAKEPKLTKKPKPRKMTKADCYEQATAPVSDIETIIDELDQIESEAPKSMQVDLGEARAYLRMAVEKLMGLEA